MKNKTNKANEELKKARESLKPIIEEVERALLKSYILGKKDMINELRNEMREDKHVK